MPVLYERERIGSLLIERWFDSFNNETKLCTHYYLSGLKSLQVYHLNGFRSRDNGPAIIKFYETGEVSSEIFCLLGKVHRDNGPAILNYDLQGNTQSFQYFYLGDFVTVSSDEEFIKYIEDKKFSEYFQG